MSHWPILEVWTAHRDEAVEALPTFDRRTTRLAVYRAGGRLRLLEVSAPRFAFWRQLVGGASLETALSRAMARDATFDLVAELVVLFRAGLVTGISTEPSCIN
jgi:hypothetical protein